MELGIVGVNSRAAAASARKLGHSVHLVDYFSDLDVEADYHYPMQSDPLKPDPQKEYTKEKLVDYAIKRLADKVDAVIPTSEVGCSHLLLKKLEKHFIVLGNNSKKVEESKDWNHLKKVLDKIGVEYPKTEAAYSLRKIKWAAEEIGYPVVVKGVGMKAELFNSENEINSVMLQIPEEGCLVQEKVEGEAVSASVISNGTEAQVLSVNKQLIGLNEFNANGFTYCGNIVPFFSEYYKEIAEKAADLVESLGLVGSNGVDFLIGDESLIFMEVNTRLQDTLECVEKYLGVNLIHEHIKAIEGKLTEKREGCGCFGKGILYAESDSLVEDIWLLQDVGDIPHSGATIKASDPVCSIYASADSPEKVLSGLKEKAAKIRAESLRLLVG